MAQPTMSFEYWDGDSWTKALTHTGKNALVLAEIEKITNEPDRAHLVLTNSPKDPSSTDTTKSKGLLTDVFIDDGVNRMLECVLRDEETGMVLFRGKVYKIKNRYQVANYGSIIRLELRDALQELSDLPLEKSYPSVQRLNVTGTGQVPDTTKRSGIIQKVIQTVTNTYRKHIEPSHGFSDTTKFEGSLFALSSKDILGIDTRFDHTLGEYFWNLELGSHNALEFVQEVAETEPLDAIDLSKHYGFDFSVDANFSTFDTSNAEINPPPHFNYFKRGTRPSTSQSTDADPEIYGVTLEYPSSNWPTIANYTKKSFIRRITQDADFDNDENEMYTHAIVEWEIDDATEDDRPTTSSVKESFHLIKATIPSGNFTNSSSTGKSLWEDRRLIYDGNDGADFTESEGTDGTNQSIFTGTNDQSSDVLNPTFLYKSNQTYPCAVLNYVPASGNGTNADYIIVSNVFDNNIKDNKVIGGEEVSDRSGIYTLHYFQKFEPGGYSRINMGGNLSASATTLTVDDVKEVGAWTQLAGGINDSVVSFDVDDASVFNIGDIVQIGSEEVQITVIASNTLTVSERGLGSTSEASHSDNDYIYIPLVLRIEDELVNVTARNFSTNNLTITRGYSSTTGAIHLNNTLVYKSVRLHTRKSKATNATDVPYVDVTPSIGRASEKYGISKPVPLTFHRIYNNTELVRKAIANELDKRSRATLVKAKVRTSRYPYTRLIAQPDNISRSNNVLTFATAPTATDNINMGSHFGASATALVVDSVSGFSIGDIIACTTSSVTEQMKITAINSDTNTFTVTRAVNGTTAVQHANNLEVTGAATFTPADGKTMTNDVRKFGVKKGMIVAQLKGDSSTVKRYAYITAVSATTVTYGNLITVGGSANQAKDTNDLLEINAKLDEVGADINDSATTLQVDTGTRFETNDVILIGTEQMLVTAVSGNNLTVVRGHNNTTAASHSENDDVKIYNPIAIFVPVEPGHAVRIKHKQWGVDEDFYVEKMNYEVGEGIITTTLECLGMVRNGVGIAPIKRTSGKRSRSGGGTDGQGLSVSLPNTGQSYTILDGSVLPFDSTHIQVKPENSNETSVTIVTSGGNRYKMLKTAGTLASPHIDISGGARTGQLNEPLDASETTITVDYTTVFNPNDVILIDSEQMKINKVSVIGTNYTNLHVTRGFNSTTAATHSDNTAVATVGSPIAQPHVLYYRPFGYGASKRLQVAPYQHGSTGTNYHEIAHPNDVIIGWAQVDKFSFRGSSTVTGLTGGNSSPLNGAISDAPAPGTTQNINVDDGTKYTIGDVVLAEEEEFSVYGISSNTLSIVRGVNGTTPATHADDTTIEVKESTNTSTNSTATLKLNGAGSIGDRGSLDVRELSPGAFPGFDGSSYSLTFDKVNSRIVLQDPTNNSGVIANSIQISDNGLSFHLPSAGSTQINMAGNLGNNASTDTSVVVDDASVFAVNSIITIDSEKMKISGISSNTLTVTRAHQGTSVASHNDNATVSGLGGHNEAAAGPDKKITFHHNASAFDTASFTSGSTQFTRMGYSTPANVQASGTPPGAGRNLYLNDTAAQPEIAASTSSDDETLAVASRFFSNNLAIEAPRFYASSWGTGTSGSKLHPSYTFGTDLDTGMYQEAAGNINFSANDTKVLTITASGISIAGSISKSSGDFKIDHPLEKDKKDLYHGFIEGPQYDLIYRGQVTLSSGTATVNIDTVSNMSVGTFVALTQNPDYFLQNNTGWGAVKGDVSGNALTITAENNNSTDTISWMVVAERADDHIKSKDITDDDGHLIPEQDKPDLEE